MNNNILEVNDLKVHFPIKGQLIPKTVGYVKAVDGVGFDIEYGETLGLVGESGCGKSTTGRAILRLLKVNSGRIFFEGKDVLKLKKNELKETRKNMQLIFQDPYASLNPRMTIGDAIEEVLLVHNFGTRLQRNKRTEELIQLVGLSKTYLTRHPHEFSGGQRQRIVIARALAVEPKLLICDEPVSALDVSIQSQIINLLENLQKELDIAYLFIAHDLSVVKHISKRIAVMYLGKIVEVSDSDELFRNALHPYTQALLSAIPVIDPDSKKKRIILEGDMQDIMEPPKGCRFNNRCMYAMDRCYNEEPETIDFGGGHTVDCHLYK
ncbi:ABC transporter ATP-binding protein [Gudongella sp. DL1XJH-153]|uniref:ABC transporter ATP-binding protein n=1 Tax=Gudongella sp. DL1XJH-153 TaxID=3409804 RepID=UPI003BB4E54D